MRAFVFTDPALTDRARQFVWLELNFDDARNAELIERLSCEALPAFYIVNPADESVALRVVDSMNVAELGAFLDQGRAAVLGVAPTSPLEGALLAADRLDAQGKKVEAASAYREVIARAPADWPPYGRVAVALLYLYQAQDKRVDCVAVAREALPRLPGAAAGVKVGTVGLDCAVGMSKDDPARSGAVSDMERSLRASLTTPPPGAAADDLSAGYASLIAARKAAGDAAGAAKDANAWASFLEAQAEAARTPQQRAVFDSHRLSAYLELGQPERAVTMLERSERELPGDYNPPARLAVAYLRLEKLDAALAASDRALAKVNGPRRVQVLVVRSNVLAAKGDALAAQATLEQAIAHARSLPPGQRSEVMIRTLEERLSELRAKTPSAVP
jgi:tetratricopeptide (TPR) repeat protein